MNRILTTRVRSQEDVVRARQRARALARFMGFDPQDQVRVATAVSEIARNAFEYGGGGDVEYLIDNQFDLVLQVVISDQGPGIQQLDAVLDGTFRSVSGMGVGISGARRLLDRLEIRKNVPKGTRVELTKILPRRGPLTNAQLGSILSSLAERTSHEELGDAQDQNRDLMHALAELQQKSRELEQKSSELQEKSDSLVALNDELEATNRGVVALYGELDEKAEALRKANELKTRFLSNITHEFRTPLGSMVTLADLLMEGAEGPVNPEQANVIRLMRRSASELLELVNDLLDLAKVEAGKIPVKVTIFQLEEFLASLRLLLKPLTSQYPNVTLEFTEAYACEMRTDEGKLTQILRNLISNAMKYTPSGAVTVRAEKVGMEGVRFSVRDTGIGIATGDLDRIFEEFVQIESGQQAKYKGTGLGLSLTQKLVHLLGGEIHVASELGQGSTFTVTLATQYRGPAEAQYVSDPTTVIHPSPFSSLPSSGTVRILIIDDEPDERAFLHQALQSLLSSPDIMEVSDGSAGLRAARTFVPQLIFLDLNMPVQDGFETFRLMQQDEDLRRIPVVIHSGRPLRGTEKDLFLNAAAIISKTELSEEAFLRQLQELVRKLGHATRAWR